MVAPTTAPATTPPTTTGATGQAWACDVPRVTTPSAKAPAIIDFIIVFIFAFLKSFISIQPSIRRQICNLAHVEPSPQYAFDHWFMKSRLIILGIALLALLSATALRAGGHQPNIIFIL